MLRRRSFLPLCAAIISLSLTGMAPNAVRAGALALPDSLSDGEFWNMVTELSEPDGEFRSDNLLSNELFFQTVIPELLRTSKIDRVYLGVGPEQNFTYISALKPTDGVHHRHPPRQLAAAPDVQGALRVVVGPRRFHLQAVLEKASGRAGCQGDRRRDLHRRRRRQASTGSRRGGSALQAEPQARSGSLDGHASPAADARRPERHRLRLRNVFVVRPGVVVLVIGAAAAAAAPPPTGT